MGIYEDWIALPQAQKVPFQLEQFRKLPIGKEVASRGVRIEISRIEINDPFVSVYARAWQGNDQIGFGPKRDTEWEHWRIQRPTFTVSAPGGPIRTEGEFGRHSTGSTRPGRCTTGCCGLFATRSARRQKSVRLSLPVRRGARQAPSTPPQVQGLGVRR